MYGRYIDDLKRPGDLINVQLASHTSFPQPSTMRRNAVIDVSSAFHPSVSCCITEREERNETRQEDKARRTGQCHAQLTTVRK